MLLKFSSSTFTKAGKAARNNGAAAKISEIKHGTLLV